MFHKAWEILLDEQLSASQNRVCSTESVNGQTL